MNNEIIRLFSTVSSNYDKLNRILSLGQDLRWRRKAVSSFVIPEKAKILDLCTGTAELAVELAKKGNNYQIYGLDFSWQMLELAKEKMIRQRKDRRIHLIQADVLNAPVQEGVFDAVTISFGLRNLADYPRGLAQILKMLKKGGTAMILEFSPPANNFPGKIAGFYIKNILPELAGLFGGSSRAYLYLSSSIGSFLSPEEILNYMSSAGLKDLKRKNLCFGAVNSYYGTK